MSGGALELEDLAGVVGAVGLLATLADEFVGAEATTPSGILGGSGSTQRWDSALVTSDEDGGGGNGEGEGEGEGDGEGGEGVRVGGGRGSPGSALRECLSGMAKEFFQGANKVRWDRDAFLCYFVYRILYTQYVFSTLPTKCINVPLCTQVLVERGRGG